MSLTKEEIEFVGERVFQHVTEVLADSPERRTRIEEQVQIWTELFGDYRPASTGEAVAMGYKVKEEYERRLQSLK